MADNNFKGHDEQDAKEKVECSYMNHTRRQRMTSKIKNKMRESRLPTPPPDPRCLQGAQNQGKTSIQGLDEEDMFAYLTGVDIPLFENQPSACSSRHSTDSTISIGDSCTSEAFEHLHRLYDLVEQILELRDRNSKVFKRVRNLERLKVLRNADLRLENAFQRDVLPVTDFRDGDTGFAETLLDAILSNSRDPLLQRRNVRSSSSKCVRNKSLAPSQQSLEQSLNFKNNFDAKKLTSDNEIYKNTPKVSKWTRVKAAFKWERARTNDIMETADTPTTITKISSTASPCSTTKYLKIRDVENGNDLRNDTSSHLDYQPLKEKEDKEECNNRRSRFFKEDINMSHTEQINDANFINEVHEEKPPTKGTPDKNYVLGNLNLPDKKTVESISMKRISPLTITIPPNEEEIWCMSSPESTSSVSPKQRITGDNSSQRRQIQQELLANKEMKQQRLIDEESVKLASKLQRQNSKWNKVRRAFLWNSTFSVPPSPTRDSSRQMFLQDDMYSSSSSVEDLEKSSAINFQAERQRDYYRFHREKFGAEFHRKLIEWERLKSSSPRVTEKNVQDVQSRLFNPRKSFLPEESLIPEFKKRLQDWKCSMKERRGSAPLVHRANRRRLTDWQLWKPSKCEYKSTALHNDCEARENTGKTYLSDDLQKTEAWKRANGTSNHDAKRFVQSNSNQIRTAGKVDKNEFLPLEKALSLFDNNANRKRREFDIRQFERAFDEDTRSNISGAESTSNSHDTFETPTGSYQLDDISSKSSPFRFLGSVDDLFRKETNVDTLAITPTMLVKRNKRVFLKNGVLKKSKSLNDMIEDKLIRPVSFMRSLSSLQSSSHLADELANNDFIDTIPVSDDSQKAEDMAEDVLDDSETEAMIIDIEDVIEETACPLEKMQPYQTPVYSVAVNETTSIAVPLGTITSSCEQDTFFVEIGNLDGKSKICSQRKNLPNQESLNKMDYEITKTPNKNCANQDNVNSNCRIDQGIINNYEKSDSACHSMDVKEELHVSKMVTKSLNQDHFAINRKEILTDSSNVEKIMVNMKEEELNELSFTTPQSQLATCWYNQDLPSEKAYDREFENDDELGARGSSNDRKDVTKIDAKCNDEYEEIVLNASDPYYYSLADAQSTKSDDNERNIQIPHDASANCKLGLSGCSLSCVDSMDEEIIHSKIHGRMDDVVKPRDPIVYHNLSSPNCDEQYDYIDEEIEQTENCKIKRPSEILEEFEYCESFTEEIPPTISPSCDEYCYDKIIIEEDTSDSKNMNPTHKIKDFNQSIEKNPGTKNSLENNVDIPNVKSDTTSNDATNTKKQYSITRNAFNKTKRIISSPFRRGEDYSISKKKGNVSDDDLTSLMKNKNDAKSSVTKLYQQEPFLKTSFSLPWPLRLSSKNRKTEETKIKEKRKNSLDSPGFQSTQIKPKVQFWEKRRSSIAVVGEKFKYHFGQQGYEPSVLGNQVAVTASCSSLKTEEKKHKSSLPIAFDPHSPDIIHKLKILSNVVARKDGRNNTIAEELSMEQYSSYRRDESHCRSVLEPQLSKDYNSSRVFQNYEKTLEDQSNKTKNGNELDTNDDTLKLDESSRNVKDKRASMKEEKLLRLHVNRQDEHHASDSTISRSDRVKSASVGMINIDPDVFDQLTESNRRCESLPRTISQQKSLGLFSKIANRFRLGRLIQSKDFQGRDMSTISALCRQSLLINIRNDFGKC